MEIEEKQRVNADPQHKKTHRIRERKNKVLYNFKVAKNSGGKKWESNGFTVMDTQDPIRELFPKKAERKNKKGLHIYSGTQNFFMEKIYHIYAGDKCLMHSLREQEFLPAWRAIQSMIAIVNTEYKIEDLSYEELLVNKELEASY